MAILSRSAIPTSAIAYLRPARAGPTPIQAILTAIPQTRRDTASVVALAGQPTMTTGWGLIHPEVGAAMGGRDIAPGEPIPIPAQMPIPPDMVAAIDADKARHRRANRPCVLTAS